MFFKRKKEKNVTDQTQNTDVPEASARDVENPDTAVDTVADMAADTPPAESSITNASCPEADTISDTISDLNSSGTQPNPAIDADTETIVRPGHEAPREKAHEITGGRGSVFITFGALITALVLLALFTFFMPERPLWLTQEPQIAATANAGAWLPGQPAMTPYPLFNWLVVGIEYLSRNTLYLSPHITLQAAAYVCMAIFLLSVLSLSRATDQPRKTGMAAVLLLFAMGPVAGLAWFARPETLFAGLVTCSFGFFFWAARRQKAFVSMILAAIAAVLALLCGGIWGALLPLVGLILFCLLGLKPKRLLALDTAIAVGIIIAVPLIFGAGCMLFVDKNTAEAFFSAQGYGFLHTLRLPVGFSFLWRTPLILICFALPWILEVFLLHPRRVKSWVSTLPLWLMLLCLAVWGGLGTSGDIAQDVLILLPALPPLAVILARWAILLEQPRIGIFTRIAGLVLFLAGLAATLVAVIHVASLTSIEAMLPVRIPDFIPFWSVLVPGLIAMAMGVAVWCAARRVTDLKAVAVIAVAVLITGQAVGQLFLPQLTPRFTFSIIGPAIQAYERDGVPTIAMDMPVNSLYAWSPNILYLDSQKQLPADTASHTLVMPLRSWEKDATALPQANIITQTVGCQSYVLVPVLHGPLGQDISKPHDLAPENPAEPNSESDETVILPDQNVMPESSEAQTPEELDPEKQDELNTRDNPGAAHDSTKNKDTNADNRLDNEADKNTTNNENSDNAPTTQNNTDNNPAGPENNTTPDNPPLPLGPTPATPANGTVL